MGVYEMLNVPRCLEPPSIWTTTLHWQFDSLRTVSNVAKQRSFARRYADTSSRPVNGAGRPGLPVSGRTAAEDMTYHSEQKSF